MIIQPSLPGGYVIFCDDIRHEVRGKTTLVGTYTGEMTIYGTSPVRLTRLAAVIVYRDDPATFPKSVSIRIVKDRPEEEILFNADIEVPQFVPAAATQADPETLTFTELRIHGNFENVEFTEACQLKVRAYVGEDEIRLGALRVKIAPVEDAPPPQ